MKPELSVKETYDDNINFTPSDELDDYITTVSPSLSLGRDTEKLDAELKADADILRYASEDEFDAVDDEYDLILAYVLTQKLLINIDSNFLRDSNIERELEETGLFTLSAKEEINVLPSFLWWISELNGLRLTSYYKKARYDNPFYLDYELYSGFLEWGHLFSSRQTAFFIHSGYGLADYEYGTMENYGLLTGFDFEITENWSLSFRGGVQQMILEADLDELPIEVIGYINHYNIDTEEDELEPIGYVILERSFEKGHSISAEFTKEIVPSGESATLDRLKGKIVLEYFFTEHFKGNLQGAWFSSESLIKYLPLDKETYTGTLWFQYQFREATSVKLSYRYSTYTDFERDNDATKNLVFIEFIQDWNTMFKKYNPSQKNILQIWKRFLKF